MRPRLSTLLALALPTVLARASQAVITFADVIQIKHLGNGAIAATASGGLNSWMFIILPMGIAFIIQSFVAQLTGRGEREHTRRFAYYGLVIAALAAVIALVATPFVRPVLGFASYSPDVRDMMASYIAIRLLSTGAAVGVEALGNWYGGLGNTWMQMISGVVTMGTAIVMNAILIPRYGVDGAAIASVIATWLGFAVIALAFALGWGGAPKPAGPLGMTRRELVRVFRFGLPNGINWFLEFTAFQLFVNVVVAGLGDTTVAALNVVIAVNAIAFMPAFGLASAGAILAGQAIGSGARDDVWPIVRLALACTIAWEGAMSIAYVAIPSTILGWFAPENGGVELLAIGSSMLVTSALWQVFDATNMTLSETLRAAGDTAWTAGARIVIAWAVFAPGSYLIVGRLGGGAVGAMGCLVGYFALLASAFAYRFRSGAWKRIELIEPKLI